mmetsp:Transcript_40581/g.90202  ORF Transcript_40581/g.90202 Transcript_40581/m.90202 type:complete len:206 (+) Transcript_40581:184-801(+)|eukprot:CAMPEP_0202892068 /NCGR_PEP_ID=MMETSP1392-20130828/1910_1 /ASSEMBLY_ACC=CAM_ASM_000868 /TAXON_ID=225041 /ORGANISM="Chlamydomonas chlamydogama, Strain SAG 11-48b" /LENGTH=205 /DNA_ID=CAMNT_0049575945 /DNA_START=182 /DNA_END=799 /DNA_ORIENTATION=+
MEDKYIVDDQGFRRLKDTEYVLPICVGTVAWWLGKKANEYNSHRWTVYVRGPNNEDLSHVIQKVTFELHHTFPNPNRTIEQQPYEVTENGWGEFEIGVTLYFVPDAREKEVTLYHKLRLYEEDGSQSTKKPVVTETYDELIFSEPHEAFFTRVVNHVPTQAAGLMSHHQWVPRHDEAAELQRIRACRAKVAAMIADLRRDYDAVR